MKSILVMLTTIVMTSFFSCWSGKQAGQNPEGLLKKLNDKHVLTIKDQVIDETLDFNRLFLTDELSHAIETEIQFVNCTFKKDLMWESKTGKLLIFRDDVVFRDCTFEGEVKLNDARFEGRVMMSNCVFTRSLDLQRSRFDQQVRIEQCEFGNDLVLQYSRNDGDVSLLHSKIGRDVMLQGLSSRGKWQMGNLQCQGSIDLSRGDFHEEFSANYIEVGRRVFVSNCRFYGNFSMYSAVVTEMVNLKRSRVYGEFLMSAKDGEMAIEDEGFVLMDKIFEKK